MRRHTVSEPKRAASEGGVTPAQQQAWRKLWDLLLAAPTEEELTELENEKNGHEPTA